MMNFPFNSNKENTEKHVGSDSCHFSYNVYNHHRDLANTLMDHQEENSSRDVGKYQGSVLHRTKSFPDLLNFPGGTTQLNVCKFFRNNPRNMETRCLTSPARSSGIGSSVVHPLDSSMQLGLNEVFVNRGDHSGTYMDDVQFYSLLPSGTSDSRETPYFVESTTTLSLPPDLRQGPIKDEVTQRNNSNKGKRPSFSSVPGSGADVVNAAKKPKFSSDP